MQRKMVILVLTLLLSLNILLILFESNKDIETTHLINALETPIRPFQDGLWIEGNVALAAKSSSGNGTEEDPYIIEDLIIDDGITIHPEWDQSRSVYGIYIENTDKFFVIRNCSIYLPYHPPEYDWFCWCYREFQYYCGISLNHVKNGYLNNNTVSFGIQWFKYSLSLGCSTNITISDNIFTDDDYSISLYNSNHNKIINNTVKNNFCGLNLLNSSDNMLTNNLIINNFYGLRLEDFSTSNFVSNNSFLFNNFGIYEAESCEGNIFQNNIIQDASPLPIIPWLIPSLICIGVIVLIFCIKRRSLSRVNHNAEQTLNGSANFSERNQL